ncbi:MAG TPA: hypothetical protein VMT58_04915 [Candidatus Binataceae bacterium]|nr:hypothetical protein [Candidatus Binataceae bacterium]
MNCFDARREFAALWRAAVSAERKAELLAHLGDCAKCDRAFRLFALTAPALHSEPKPGSPKATADANSDFPFGTSARRLAAAPVYFAARPRWMAIAAAIAIFALSSAAVGLAEYAPSPSIADAISSPDSAASAPDTAQDPYGVDQSPEVGDFAS